MVNFASIVNFGGSISLQSKIENADQFQNQCRNNFWWYNSNKIPLARMNLHLMNIFLMTQQVTNISKVQFSSISKMKIKIFQLDDSKWAQLRATCNLTYIIKDVLSNVLMQKNIFFIWNEYVSENEFFILWNFSALKCSLPGNLWFFITCYVSSFGTPMDSTSGFD